LKAVISRKGVYIILCSARECAAGRLKSGFLCIPKCHSAIGKPVLIAGRCRRICRIGAFSSWTDYSNIVNLITFLYFVFIFFILIICLKSVNRQIEITRSLYKHINEFTGESFNKKNMQITSWGNIKLIIIGVLCYLPLFTILYFSIQFKIKNFIITINNLNYIILFL